MIPFLRKTWGNDDRVKVIYYQGGSEENYLDGDKLYLDAGTSIDDTCEKLLAALEWINKNEQFDIIFRATTTTYLDIMPAPGPPPAGLAASRRAPAPFAPQRSHHDLS